MNNKTKRKRVLVYLFSFFPYEDANTIASIPLIEQLNSDYEVELVCCDKNNKGLVLTEQNNITVYWYKPLSKITHRISEWEYAPLSKYKHLLGRIKIVLQKTIAFFFFKLCKRNDDTKIIQLFSKTTYDLFVTITSPIITQYSGIRLRKSGILKNTKWIAIFQDSYAGYISNKSFSRELYKREEEVLKNADMVFIIPEIIEAHETDIYDSYKEKIRFLPVSSLNNPHMCKDYDASTSSTIECLYVGSLQDIQIRNPKVFFEVAASCKSEIQTIIVVNQWCDACNDLYSRILSGKGNITRYPGKSHDECMKMINKADILINLGNQEINQMPSKIWEYLSFGKPIVHFSSVENDPVTKLLRRYPLSLIINNSDNSNVERFNSFCKLNAKGSMRYNDVARLYTEYTTSAVKEKFAESYRELFEN